MDDDAWERIQEEQERARNREFVRFAMYRVDPAWRRLAPDVREAHKAELEHIVARWSLEFMVYGYALVGTRGDGDFLLWQASRDIDHFHGLAADMNRSGLGGFLSLSHSLLSMTRRSIYVNRHETEYLEHYGGADKLESARIAINPQGSKYLFVYPMEKTRAWYELPHEDRQEMMDEHIRVGHRWPDVKINTTYSYGIDDQEFVLAFESDHPGRFVDLLMALRLTRASSYTRRDTPAFTGLAMPLRAILDSLG